MSSTYDTKRAAGVVLLITVLISGCGNYYSLRPVAAKDQKISYQQGKTALVSQKGNIVVITPEYSELNGQNKLGVSLGVTNLGSQSFVFSSDNVRVMTDQGPLKVYSYDEIQAEENRRQSGERLVAALQVLDNSVNDSAAGYQYEAGTVSSAFSGNINNPYSGQSQFSGSGQSTYQGYRYDPNAAAQAQLATQLENERIAENVNADAEAQNADLSARMLKIQTIDPGQTYGGVVRADLPASVGSGKSVSVIVDVGGEEHQFAFELRPSQ